MKLILCVEDELDVLDNNRKAFEDAGYDVLTAVNLEQARELLSTQTPDAIVLDIMLPDGLGLDFLQELRTGKTTVSNPRTKYALRISNHEFSKVPVILLTAWDKPYDVARGLRLGANDYLSKPFAYEVLLARVEAMFRNVEQIPRRITYGKLSFDISSGQAYANEVELTLKPKEYSLLLLFVQNARRVMDAEELYRKVWNAPLLGDKNTLQATISALRRKITSYGYDIDMIRGKGYYFE